MNALNKILYRASLMAIDQMALIDLLTPATEEEIYDVVGSYIDILTENGPEQDACHTILDKENAESRYYQLMIITINIRRKSVL